MIDKMGTFIKASFFKGWAKQLVCVFAYFDILDLGVSIGYYFTNLGYEILFGFITGVSYSETA
jgi:hypothetical protein